MKEPEVPEHGPRKWRAFAADVVTYIKTIRPVAGSGIRVSEIKGGGTQISTGLDSGGGLILTLCQNRELRRFSVTGRDLGPVDS
jgi:hypothetical protein